MKKTIFNMLLTIISLFAFGLSVNAASAPSSITAGPISKMKDYVSGGSTVYLKKTSDGAVNLYCEVANLKFPSNKTIKLNEEVHKGFVYILQNQPNLGDKNQQYYIVQTATWWYRDILNNNNSNLTKSFKDYCTNNRSSNATCGYIYNLVQGAKNYKPNMGKMTFNTNTITFTESNGYFYSNTISITSEYLNSWDGVTFSGAPTNTQVYNSSISNGTGTFQIRIPVSSVQAGTSTTFKIELNGKYNSYSVYDYYYGSGYQTVVYDKVYYDSHPVYSSRTATVSRNVVKQNSLTITKVDANGKKINDAILTLYKGNCANTTCKSSDVYKSWTTYSSQNPYKMTNLPLGTYTLAETYTPSGYQTAAKKVINISRNDYDYTEEMVNYSKVTAKNNSLTVYKKDQNGNMISGAEITLYKGDCTNTTCSSNNYYTSWTTTSSAKVLTDLPLGTYTIVETYTPEGYKGAPKDTVHISSDDSNIEYTLVNDKILNTNVKISKTDITGANEVPGASLVVKKLNGEVVDSWVSSNTPHTVTLSPGEYTLTETLPPNGYKLNQTTIYFKVDNDNNVYQKNELGEYVLVDTVTMVNTLNDNVSISKLDSKTNAFVSGAKLVIKNMNGEIVAAWETINGSHNVALAPGEYMLIESAPANGYEKTNEVIYFKLLDDGTLQIKNANNVYENADGIILYNNPTPEEVIVPKTGLSSALTYISGSLILVSGAWVLLKNGVRA